MEATAQKAWNWKQTEEEREEEAPPEVCKLPFHHFFIVSLMI